MMLLLAQIDNPPIDGVSGWVIGLAVSSILASASAVWSEYQRRGERKDKKEGERTVAEISAGQKHLELSYKIVSEVVERQAKQNELQAQQMQVLQSQINDTKSEYMKVLDELRQERADSRLLIGENSELKLKVGTLESRIAQLETEMRSLERSRDDAMAACKRSEETSPRS